MDPTWYSAQSANMKCQINDDLCTLLKRWGDFWFSFIAVPQISKTGEKRCILILTHTIGYHLQTMDNVPFSLFPPHNF